MSCVLDTSLLGYLLGLALPTLFLTLELYLLRVSPTVPLTVAQQDSLELAGIEAERRQRLVAGVFCVTGLLVAVPIHYLLLADCL